MIVFTLLKYYFIDVKSMIDILLKNSDAGDKLTLIFFILNLPIFSIGVASLKIDINILFIISSILGELFPISTFTLMMYVDDDKEKYKKAYIGNRIFLIFIVISVLLISLIYGLTTSDISNSLYILIGYISGIVSVILSVLAAILEILILYGIYVPLNFIYNTFKEIKSIND